MNKPLRSDITIIGAGLAGLVAALELLDQDCSIALFDRDQPHRLGGLARDAFGGMALAGTPIQRWHGIQDSPDLLLEDWLRFGEIPETDIWPRRWAELYANRCLEDVYLWLKHLGVHFFPIPHWVERGEFGEGNSVPRYHIIWGTGHWLIESLINQIENHPNRKRLEIRFQHQISDFIHEDGKVVGCTGIDEKNEKPFEIHSPVVIVACGGINGNIERVKREWDRTLSNPPEIILKGSHPFANGEIHDQVTRLGGNVTHLEQMWNYAAGVHKPGEENNLQGLSLIPPKSALWVNAKGERFAPHPLVTGFDTTYLCHRIANSGYSHSWQILNYKIALKELAVSGADYNAGFKHRQPIRIAKDLIFGYRDLVNDLMENCIDFVVADTMPDLVTKMQQRNGDINLHSEHLIKSIKDYDREIDRGKSLCNDEQLRRIAHVRKWRGDKSRTCGFQKIIDPKAGPLIAIREFIISRKSMGGVQTNLDSQVLSSSGSVIEGLYCIGEAAGFGGGGICGKRSLEGTFLSNCILNAKQACRAIRR